MEAPSSPLPPIQATCPSKFTEKALTFDDVLLLPAESWSLPAEVDTSTHA